LQTLNTTLLIADLQGSKFQELSFVETCFAEGVDIISP